MCNVEHFGIAEFLRNHFGITILLQCHDIQQISRCGLVDRYSVVFLLKWLMSNLLFCRCGRSHHLFLNNLLVCTSTLRHSSGGILVCSNHHYVAIVHGNYWHIQHFSLEPTCLPSTFSALHVQVLEENKERWLDVLGRNSIMHDR